VLKNPRILGSWGNWLSAELKSDESEVSAPRSFPLFNASSVLLRAAIICAPVYANPEIFVLTLGELVQMPTPDVQDPE